MKLRLSSLAVLCAVIAAPAATLTFDCARRRQPKPPCPGIGRLGRQVAFEPTED
jgi:hypothetical protein